MNKYTQTLHGIGSQEPPIIDWLIAAGHLQEQARERIIAAVKETGNRTEKTIINLNLVSEKQMVDTICRKTAYNQYIDDDDFTETVALLLNFIENHPFNDIFLNLNDLIPIAYDDQQVTFVSPWPPSNSAIQAICFGLEPRKHIIEIAPYSVFSKIQTAFYGSRASHDDSADDIGIRSDDSQRLADSASKAPVIQFVNNLIDSAVAVNASDIHIEPSEDGIAIRLRIDGVLERTTTPDRPISDFIVPRLKILTNLNITERRLPQDGRIRFPIQGREIDIRVSIMPSIHGEKIVMRLLDKEHMDLTFPALGFNQSSENQVLNLLKKRHGILLITGPTGSGKTTTLYTALKVLNQKHRNIMTAEDPVEYSIPGITQVQVQEDIGLDFPRVLRGFMRQDPDIMMIGEIRDKETANMAIRAAITGHLVLSTIHTNDAAGAITRLLDLDIEPFLLSDALVGVVGQRLLRQLCDSCKTKSKPDGFYQPKGCEDCRHTGFKNRFVINEIFTITDQFKEMISNNEDINKIRLHAANNGLIPLYENGMDAVRAGKTSLNELNQITQE